MNTKKLAVIFILFGLFFLVGGFLVFEDNNIEAAAPLPPNMKDLVEIDAEKSNPNIYGDLEGLKRVEKLEAQLHTMQIRQDHPRLFITNETMPKYRQRALQENHFAWQLILNRANSGDMVNAAFAYQILKESNPTLAQSYADIAIQKMKVIDENAHKGTYVPLNPGYYYVVWPENDYTDGFMALAFDWTYDAMNPEDKILLADKIARMDVLAEQYNQDLRNNLAL